MTKRMLEDFKASFVSLWNETPSALPDMPLHFSRREQHDREMQVEARLEWIARLPPDERRKPYVSRIVEELVVEILDVPSRAATGALLGAFREAGRTFVREVRSFDPSIAKAQVFQALRNLWIFNSLQAYLGKKPSCTRSSLAYSMLYPYTDNHLDSPRVRLAGKKDLMDMLERRLTGAPVKTTGAFNRRISHLVGLIEAEFSRPLFPHVYQALLGIHHAQRRSMLLHDSPTSTQCLDITFDKGGSSVLADGCLVNGALSTRDAHFFFGFGVLLQLIDDLQDMEDDRRKNQATMFTVGLSVPRLEALTNRLLHFTLSVLNTPAWDGPHGRVLHDLITRSCIVLILERVARRRHCYRPAYYAQLDTHSPLRFGYLSALRRRSKRILSTSRREKALPDTD